MLLTAAEKDALTDAEVIVKDDDPDTGLLPKFYTVDSFMKRAYQDAYIDIVNLDAAYNPNRFVPFDLYLTAVDLDTGAGWNNGKDRESSDAFWVSLVVASYQHGDLVLNSGPNDNDPDPQVHNSTYPNPPWWPPGSGNDEEIISGTTVTGGDWDSVIFRAAIVDFPGYPREESHSCFGDALGP